MNIKTARTHLGRSWKALTPKEKIIGSGILVFIIVGLLVVTAPWWWSSDADNRSTTFATAPAPVTIGAGNGSDTNLTLVLQGDRKALAETMSSVNQLSTTVGSIKSAVEGLQKDMKSLQTNQEQFRRQIDVNVLIKQLDERAKIPALQKVPPPLSRLEGDGLNFLPGLA